jgi:hypothetical protein
MVAVATRQTETLEFTPPDVAPVAAQLDRLRKAGQGWVNLLPGVHVEDDSTVVSSGFFGLFGNRQAPVTMATLMPPKGDRRAREGVTVGLLHPTGSKAMARLDEAGVPRPIGWFLRQDHARRGLVLRAPVEASSDDIIAWAIEAGTALCREEMTGRWQAVVYLP